ncbi:MAG: lactate racemase domain-containing protein, partial [Phycisphaerae bacterium]
RYWPERLYNHDAEDPDGNVLLGKTESGEEVEINRRAVESDLLIYVNINLVTMDGGHKSVPVGLGTYKSVRHHHNVGTLMTSRSYMDPATSSFHRSCDRMGAVVAEHVKIFTIETTLNSDTFSHALGFLQKREAQWSLFDKLNFQANRTALGLMPPPLRRAVYQGLCAPYAVTGINAGMTDPVHARTIEACHRQQLIDVDGQADIMLVGLPSIGPYSVYSILNPILVYCMAAGYFFNFYKGKPLVRKGGVMIVVHPLEYRFHRGHHPSYIDFFEEVLTETRDPLEMERRFEKEYAQSERYIHLYRTSYAYHGVHPFYMWYWGCHGMDHLGRIITVNPTSVEAARRIGFAPVPSLRAAIEQAKEFLKMPGDQAQITYFHCPPVLMCRVH